jgi:hypothetical protein
VTVSDENTLPDPLPIAHLCVEFWKLTKASQRAASQLPEREGKRLSAQVKFSDLQLSTIAGQMGLGVISFDGENYTAGMPASADNGDEYGDDDDLVVVKTIEPAIVRDMKVIHKGRVLIGRRNDEVQEE